MKTTVVWALVVLNGLLLVSFVGRVSGVGAGESAALAQNPPAGAGAVNQPPRRPGEYILIPGEITGGSSAVVYMLDINNRQLGAMSYDDTQRNLNVMPPIDLDRVFEAANATGAPANGNTNRGAGGTRGTGGGGGPRR